MITKSFGKLKPLLFKVDKNINKIAIKLRQ